MRIGQPVRVVTNPKRFIYNPITMPVIKPAEQPIPVEIPQKEPAKIGGTNG